MFAALKHLHHCSLLSGLLETNQWCRLEAPIAWGSTLVARMPSLRMFCEPACDRTRPLHGGAHWMLIRLLCGRFVSRCSRLEAPVAWGSTFDTRMCSLRMCCEPACDASSLLVELPVDFASTWWECRCDCVWSLFAGAYLYIGGETAASQ
jgi:hypothetical protein